MDYSPKIIEYVKREMPSARFDWKSKQWKISKMDEEPLMKFAHRFKGSFVSGDFAEKDKQYPIEPMPNLPQEIVDVLPILIRRQPPPFPPYGFDYQHQSIAYNLIKKRVVNGNDMGTGKSFVTVATLAIANYMWKQGVGDPVFPCVVVCPATLKYNWENEFKKFSRIRTMILNDKVRYNFMKYSDSGLVDVFIVNYEGIEKYFVEDIDIPKGKKFELKYVKFKDISSEIRSVVFDESHKVRNIKTRACKLSKGLATDKKFIFALTGTMVVNTPKDLISQLGIVNQFWRFLPPSVISQLSHNKSAGMAYFETKYCSGPKKASNLKELNSLLTKHCYYRFSKEDVLAQLPPKIRQTVLCDIDTMEEYKIAEKDLETYLYEYKNATDAQVQKTLKGRIIASIGILKNISARGKINDVCEYIKDVVEQGYKFGIFAHQHEVVDMIKLRFPHALCITGRENLTQRNHAAELFQNDEKHKLIILGIAAAGVGLNLTAASRCGFIENPWHAAATDQCENRFHRIGTKDSVNCAYFLGKGTIDIKINTLIESKRKMMNTIIGAEDVAEKETVFMEELINILYEK